MTPDGDERVHLDDRRGGPQAVVRQDQRAAVAFPAGPLPLGAVALDRLPAKGRRRAAAKGPAPGLPGRRLGRGLPVAGGASEIHPDARARNKGAHDFTGGDHGAEGIDAVIKAALRDVVEHDRVQDLDAGEGERAGRRPGGRDRKLPDAAAGSAITVLNSGWSTRTKVAAGRWRSGIHRPPSGRSWCGYPH